MSVRHLIKSKLFSVDFSGSMQHYHKVIFTEDPEPDPKPESVLELEPKRNDSDIEDIELPCGKFAISLKFLYVLIILRIINNKSFIVLTIRFFNIVDNV